MRPGCQAAPDDARLLCALGDLTVDDACYERAWAASGGRSVRAKRCLARSAQRRQSFAAVRHLVTSSRYPIMWWGLAVRRVPAGSLQRCNVFLQRKSSIEVKDSSLT